MKRFSLAAVAIALACGNESTTPSVVVLTPVSGDAQTGRVGAPLGAPFVVRGIDATGKPVAGLSVAWTVTAGGGSASPASTTTNGSGLASATLTVGNTVGTNNQTVTASAANALGSPVTFVASAVDARIAGTVSLTKGMLAPPRVERVRPDARGVGPVLRAPSLAAKQPAALAARSVAARSMVQPARPPQFRTNELLVTFRPRPLGAPSLGSRDLAVPTVARAVGEAIRSRLAPHVAAGRARVVGVSPALLAARLRVAAPELLDDVAASLRADASVATVERNGIVWSHVVGAPRSAAAIVDGHCVSLSLKRGTPQNGAWSATVSNVGSGCHRYYFSFIDSTGAEVTYPATGSLGIGCADWDTSRIQASCSGAMPPPAIGRRRSARH